MIMKENNSYLNDDLFDMDISENYLEKNMDLKKWLFIFLGHWYWFLLSVVVTMIISFVVYRSSKPSYQINSTVMVTPKVNASSILSQNYTAQQAYSVGLDNKNFINQSILLRLDSRILKTLDELDFNLQFISKGIFNERDVYPYRPYDVVFDSAHVQPIGMEFRLVKHGDKVYLEGEGENISLFDFSTQKEMGYLQSQKLDMELPADGVIKTNYCSFRVSGDLKSLTDATDKDYIYFSFINNERLINLYNQLELTEAQKGSSIIYMTLQTRSVEKGKVFLDKLMDMWLKDDLKKKNQNAVNTIRFIEGQLQVLNDTLRDMSRKLESFRVQNNVVLPEMQVDVQYKKLEEIDAQLIQFRLQKDYIKKLNGYLANRADYDKLISPEAVGINSPVLSGLIVELARIRSEISYFKGKDTHNNPYMLDLIKQEKNTLSTINENLRSLESYMSNQTAELEFQKKTAQTIQNKLPATEQKYLDMQRSFELTSQVYSLLQTRRVESDVLKASSTPDNEIIEYARGGARVSPTIVIYVVGFLLGLLLPAIVFFFLQIIKNTIEGEDQIQKITSLPILGHILFNESSERLVTTVRTKAPITETFRALRSSFDYVVKGKKQQVIMVTSSSSGEGKTFCALNLAGILSMTGKKTVLLGFDLRKPKLNEYLGIKQKEGITNYLIGRSDFDKIAIPFQPNFDIIMSGTIPPNPAELIESEVTRDFFDELRKRYDYIVVDTSPVGLVTDALLLAKYTDLNLYIVRPKNTIIPIFRNTLAMMEKSNMSKVGIVVNGIKPVKNRYGYGYGYGYGSGYGYGYGYGHGYGYGYGEEEVSSK